MTQKQKVTPSKMRRLIQTAVGSAAPGLEVSVECDGVRVTVRKDAHLREASNPADSALDDWDVERSSDRSW